MPLCCRRRCRCRSAATSPAPLPPLCRLGSYRGLGRENAIAKFSRHVLDALPKILLGGAGPGAAQQVRRVRLCACGLALPLLCPCLEVSVLGSGTERSHLLPSPDL